MVRKGVLLWLFCFLGVLGCLEYEEKIEVKRNGKVVLHFSVTMASEFFEGMMQGGGEKIDPKKKKEMAERKRKETKKKMEKVREELENIEGVDEVDLEIERVDGGLQVTYQVKWKNLKDFRKSFGEVQEKILSPEEKQREKFFQFSLSEEKGTYTFSLVYLKDKKKKANPMEGMILQFFSGKNFTLYFKAPIILETNGKLDKEKGEVFWEVPMVDLIKGKRDIKFKVKFRLKEAGSLWLYLAILLVLALGGGAGFFLLRKKG